MRVKLPRLGWRRSRGNNAVATPTNADSIPAPAEIGPMLRQRREELGLSLRDLANETRITTPVIEALERGWSDRLPERAYLASMLPLLERRLDLSPGCLEPILPARVSSRQVRSGGLRRFTPGSIDVFTTWQGSVVYAAVIILSVFSLNRQQLELTQLNSQSLEPVRANLSLLTDSAAADGDDPAVAALRPLSAMEERGLQRWLKDAAASPSQAPGVLQVILGESRRLQVSSRRGDRLNLKGSAGSLTLQLLPPVQLTITPPASPTDQVLWNGVQQQPQQQPQPLSATQAVYRLEAASDTPLRSPAAPASERPQIPPRSP